MNSRNSKDRRANFKPGSFKTSLLNCWRAMGGNFDVRKGGTKCRLLFFELFVAFSLSVTYYFLVTNFALGVPHNTTNGWVFTSCSIPGYHLEKLGDVWKGRLSGLMLSGYLFDSLLKDYTFQIDHLFQLFGLYQSVWLFLLFLTVICALRDSLFINLGIFAGLMYNFSPASGLYFYPWDLPATLFFTLAVLFFERRQMWLMVAATCAGCFFKETVLVCALLALFAGHWKWWKRILTFAGIVVVYVLGKKLLLSQLHFQVAAFSMDNATNLGGLLRPALLLDNLKALFLPTFNHAIFANAGTLLAVLVLCWRRRFLPYMVLIVVFLAGQFMYGGFNEFRIFMQVLPLSLILLSERWEEYAASGATDKLSGRAVPAWVLRETFPVLVPLTIVVIGLSTGVAAWHYYKIVENLQPDHLAQSELGKHKPDYKGDVSDLATECQLLRAEYAQAELRLGVLSEEKGQESTAINDYQRALELETNSFVALNSLAWLRASAPDSSLRNGKEAVRLAEQACQLSHYKDPVAIGILAAAYAEAGRFDDAVANAQKARALALVQGQTEVAARNEQLLELYKSGRAYHQEAATAP